jgi:glucose dehydrogenase
MSRNTKLGALALVAAPAFKARDLVAPPRADWVTNGGNTFNQRYSPFTQLNRDNVKNLKARSEPTPR